MRQDALSIYKYNILALQRHAYVAIIHLSSTCILNLITATAQTAYSPSPHNITPHYITVT